MATKKRRAKKRSTARSVQQQPQQLPKPVSLQVRLLHAADTPYYYVNYLEVGHSVYEFALTAARVPARLDDDAKARIVKEGKIDVEPVLQLLVPAKVIPQLIQALSTQYASYEQNFSTREGENSEKNK